MGTAEVFGVVGAFVLVVGGILAGITGSIAYRYRVEIKRAEHNRALNSLRATRRTAKPKTVTTEKANEVVELAGMGR